MGVQSVDMKPEAVSNSLALAVQRAIEKSKRDEFVLFQKLRARMIRRIFFQGLNASGQSIGTYSTKPMLVGSKSFSNLKGQAKSSQAINRIFATKNARRKQSWVTTKSKKKLVRLDGGYQEFRKLVGRGRNGSQVNLDLTGALKDSIVTATQSGKVVIGIRDSKNALKKKLIHKKYGVVFRPTPAELKWFDAELQKAINKNVQIAIQNAA